jgi:hypothetical protein
MAWLILGIIGVVLVFCGTFIFAKEQLSPDPRKAIVERMRDYLQHLQNEIATLQNEPPAPGVKIQGMRYDEITDILLGGSIGAADATFANLRTLREELEREALSSRSTNRLGLVLITFGAIFTIASLAIQAMAVA